ncbi:energy transducer TonB [Thiocystis violascens]|uniref:Protein TonB n=1 Tax=Thiocystis violascens (strain ATCC 17096 / DSM 198 / 6111) TaxID=765911 RepID=I3YE99_THIV6|nr:energy transducer TonB [Thiocystis violascens]AFL75317.1 TonB family protein [Thiocystis violascens DSM 198]
MTRAAAPLPSLPLWLAAAIAMVAEGAMLAGLAAWPSPRDLQAPSAPIEVSLVSVPVLAEPAAAGAAGGLSSVAEPESEPEPDPTPPPPSEPEPVVPETPPELADSEPTDPEPMVAAAPKPQPKPKVEVKPIPKPKPIAKTKPKPVSSPQPDRRLAKADPGTASNPGSPGKGSAAGAASGQDRAASSGPTSPAAYLNNPAPGYPDTARRARQEGTVYLRVLVTTGGRASDVQLAGSSGVSSLDQSAIRAVKRWRFKPARQKGQPITVWVRIPIRFKLNQ